MGRTLASHFFSLKCLFYSCFQHSHCLGRDRQTAKAIGRKDDCCFGYQRCLRIDESLPTPAKGTFPQTVALFSASRYFGLLYKF
jgi:hypothetical protein